MTDKQPQLYDLSRRKMLVGVGAVGLASVGAGLGTSALFSDREEFTDNSITAGTLDMSVTATIEAASPYFSDSVGMNAVADDSEAVMGLVVDDVKPGDWAIICFDIEVGDNPGYVRVSAVSTADDDQDNGLTEPESAVDSTDGAGNGELDDAILASIWYSYDDTAGDKSGLEGLDEVSNDDSTVDLPSQGYLPPNSLHFTDPEYGQTSSGDVDYTTLRQLLDAYASGIVLSDGSGHIMVGPDSPARYCLLLELPDFVGNEVQSDSIEFDLVFETEQVRNNDDPFNNTQVTPTALD